MNFHVGQKVVCVKRGRPDVGEQDAAVGQVYHVREVLFFDGRVGIYTEEISNPIVATRNGIMERGFKAERFRPVIARETSIEIFTRMLTPDREKVRV